MDQKNKKNSMYKSWIRNPLNHRKVLSKFQIWLIIQLYGGGKEGCSSETFNFSLNVKVAIIITFWILPSSAGHWRAIENEYVDFFWLNVWFWMNVFKDFISRKIWITYDAVSSLTSLIQNLFYVKYLKQPVKWQDLVFSVKLQFK